MDEIPFLEPEDPDPADDEADADKEPCQVCRYCGAEECSGSCEKVLGYGAP